MVFFAYSSSKNGNTNINDSSEILSSNVTPSFSDNGEVEKDSTTLPNKNIDQTERYTVTRVIDGDTFSARKKGETKWNSVITVRLKGVDTPETVHPNKPPDYFGHEASQFTKAFLKDEDVYLYYGSEGKSKDKYGRTLAYAYRVSDGKFVNLELIKGGYARVYRRFPCDFRDLFNRWEAVARREKKGLWLRDLY